MKRTTISVVRYCKVYDPYPLSYVLSRTLHVPLLGAFAQARFRVEGAFASVHIGKPLFQGECATQPHRSLILSIATLRRIDSAAD